VDADDNLKVGDCFLMQVASPVPNHAAVYLGDGLILHHLQGRLSSRDVYGGYWQKVTTHILGMVTIILLGELGRRFGRRHSARHQMASAAEAVRALCANFPAFERELVASGERGVGYRVLAGRDASDAGQIA
jgi:hypothetical protein